MRRIRGVTKLDRLRSGAILEDLKVSPLSSLVEERQLRYLGHVWRFDDSRWTKFLLQAERPGQTKTGKQHQYVKYAANLLESKELTTDMMQDSKTWQNKLDELYPRGKSEEGKEEDVIGGLEITG